MTLLPTKVAALLTLLVLPFVAVQKARAVPVVPQCAPGTIGQYEALANGCSLGDKIFGGFDFLSVFGDPPTGGADILVTPIMTPLNPGFMFVAKVPFDVDQTTGVGLWNLDFFTRVQPGGHAIKDISLKINGITVTADASIKISEGACLGGLFIPFAGCQTKDVAEADTAVTPTQNKTMDKATFDPVLLVNAVTGISLDPGTRGSASLTTISEQFSEVPEPSALAVLVVGMLGIMASIRLSRRSWSN